MANGSTIWKARIVGHDRVDPDSLVANPHNHRKHPQRQRDVVAASIAELGFIRSVTVNKTTGNVVDGHERVWQALTTEQPLIDVEYVELSEADERKALAILDKSAELAEVDPAALDDLLQGIDTGSEDLQELFAELAGDAGLYADDVGRDVPVSTIDMSRPPAMSWVLVGLPTVRFGEIAETVEALSAVDGVFCEMSVSNKDDDED